MKKLLILIFILFITACSTKPVYYSKSEVNNYTKTTFGSEYKLQSIKEEKDDTKEHNPKYIYTYKNKEGFKFNVYATTSHSSIDASKTSFYEKKISNDYAEKRLEFKKKELNKFFKTLSFKIEYGTKLYDVVIYLNNYSQIDEAAYAIAEIDKILDLNVYDPNDIWKHKRYVNSSYAVYYDENSKYEYVTIYDRFSNNKEERLKASEVAKELKEEINKKN